MSLVGGVKSDAIGARVSILLGVGKSTSSESVVISSDHTVSISMIKLLSLSSGDATNGDSIHVILNAGFIVSDGREFISEFIDCGDDRTGRSITITIGASSSGSEFLMTLIPG